MSGLVWVHSGPGHIPNLFYAPDPNLMDPVPTPGPIQQLEKIKILTFNGLLLTIKIFPFKTIKIEGQIDQGVKMLCG